MGNAAARDFRRAGDEGACDRPRYLEQCYIIRIAAPRADG